MPQAQRAVTAAVAGKPGEALMYEPVVTIFGNVVDQPRHLQTTTGAMTKFRVACTPRVKRDGEWVDGDTSFFDVTCWNRLADHVAGSVAKGEPVLVHGRLTMREWVTENNRGRSAEIIADRVGHDLLRGTSMFRKPGQRVPSAEGAEPEFAPPAAEAPETEDTAAA